jgi:hypothetical protein
MRHKTATPTARTPDQAATSELGLGLIGVLVGLVILAGMAAAVLASQGGAGGDHQTHSTQTTIDASPAKGAADISAAAQATCRTDYSAAAEAASEFQTLNGRPPASLAELEPFFKDPLTSSAFTITVSSDVAGQLEVETPGHPAQPGDANCAYAR